jgi:phage head maturation protease
MTNKTVYKTLKVRKIEASDQDILTFTISSGMKDRDGDIVEPDGMRANDFAQNPVMLWAHDYNSLPVARSVHLWRDTDGIKAKALFQPDNNYHESYAGIRGSMVYKMYKTGFLNAVSVGFNPLEYERLEEKGPNGQQGTHFKRWELLEFSAVPIPSNAGALVDRGQFTKALRTWAIDTKKRCDACDNELFSVDEDMLAEELANAVKAFYGENDSDTFLVDEDMLAEELERASKKALRRLGSGY